MSVIGALQKTEKNYAKKNTTEREKDIWSGLNSTVRKANEN